MLRLWLLVVLACVGALAPSRACARMAETRAEVFLFELENARPESAAQVAEPHLANPLFGYDLAPGRCLAAETTAARVASGAENNATAALLRQQLAREEAMAGKQLASSAQMGEQGSIMAGPGGRVPFRDAARVAQEYGGQPGDWAKVTSSSYRASDGTVFETHWVQNVKTGQRVEFKTKLP